MRITIKTIGIPAFIAIALGFAIAEPGHGQDIVYQPINPSFGGNPFNSAHLLGVASAQNKYKDPNAITSQDPASQFLRTLQSRLLSSLATQITDVIFGENAQDSGVIQFGDQVISFVRGVDSVTLTITNNADGSVTEIIVPLLQDSSDEGALLAGLGQ
ncbi:curli production assembly/transport component CsgF [Hephaestia caeni]|uniref:Curli production assembly/transport component CsgF n=1 Tax=Hephaestia caeni TaxID=645617 RepID=A0A397P8S1_9SPHN|nr:curli assembly protein CsgF [Hephaestia caeni]RIA43567.1 curli production assembly/transport component CsgF [Hephaestia caeni]